MQDGKRWAFGPRGDVLVPITGDLMANNGDALLAAALGGQGIIYQPDFIVGEAIRRGALVTLELDKPVVELGGIHVLYPPARRPPAKVRDLLHHLPGAPHTHQSGR